jgi:hypothetical protein
MERMDDGWTTAYNSTALTGGVRKCMHGTAYETSTSCGGVVV